MTTAAGKQLKFRRNNFAEAQFVISHKDAAAKPLLEAVKEGLMPTLRCYRKSAGQVNGTLRFNGYLAPFTEQLDEQQLITAMFRSPFGRLIGDGSSGMGRYTEAAITAEEQEQSQIAVALIELYGGQFKAGEESPVFPEAVAPGWFYAGLALGNIATTGVLQSVTYPPHENVGQAIINLSECIKGFDFDETFYEEVGSGPTGKGPTLAAFNTYIKQGSEKPGARFQYGPGTLSNVASVARTTGSPINQVRFHNAQAGLEVEASQAASIAKYGTFFYDEAVSNVTDEALLKARAEALLREGPIKTLSLYPDLGLANCPQPWDDFWLGDTIPFYGNSGAFQEERKLRVNELTVVIDENGNETTAIPDPFTATQESPDALHTVLKLEG